jgi:hypothetical protein
MDYVTEEKNTGIKSAQYFHFRGNGAKPEVKFIEKKLVRTYNKTSDSI